MAEETSGGGRTVLVTGATSGIGLEAARLLARQGLRVFVGGRDAARVQAIVDELVGAGGRAEPFVADLARLASVREGAARFLVTHPRLDVLVSNAGIAARHREVTDEGHELTWATNVLAPVLLARLLAPALLAAPRPRVVNVGSEAHRRAELHWDDLELERGYGAWRAYSQSKLALLLLTREQARREPRIAANVVHPGVIATRLWRGAPWLARVVLDWVLPPAEKGAGPVVRLAVDPALDGVTGKYFDQYREARGSVAGRDEAAAARLWDLVARAIA